MKQRQREWQIFKNRDRERNRNSDKDGDRDRDRNIYMNCARDSEMDK